VVELEGDYEVSLGHSSMAHVEDDQRSVVEGHRVARFLLQEVIDSSEGLFVLCFIEEDGGGLKTVFRIHANNRENNAKLLATPKIYAFRR
jgi:hypothetical protein